MASQSKAQKKAASEAVKAKAPESAPEVLTAPADTQDGANPLVSDESLPPVAAATEPLTNDAPQDQAGEHYSKGELQNGQPVKVAHEGHSHGVNGTVAESQAKRAYLGSSPSGFTNSKPPTPTVSASAAAVAAKREAREAAEKAKE